MEKKHFFIYFSEFHEESGHFFCENARPPYTTDKPKHEVIKSKALVNSLPCTCWDACLSQFNHPTTSLYM